MVSANSKRERMYGQRMVKALGRRELLGVMSKEVEFDFCVIRKDAY